MIESHLLVTLMTISRSSIVRLLAFAALQHPALLVRIFSHHIVTLALCIIGTVAFFASYPVTHVSMSMALTSVQSNHRYLKRGKIIIISNVGYTAMISTVKCMNGPRALT